MKKEILEITKNILRITTIDERWYVKDDKPVPSVTWISSFYPKGIPFYKWLASKGWDEAEAIKSAAGNKGSKVHQAIEDLIDGKEVKMEAKYMNPTTEELEELSVNEYECLMSFDAWHKEVQPEIISRELVVFNDKVGYAGTLDLVCKIDGQLYIVDFKTGQYLWPEHDLQISAYKHTNPDYAKAKLAFLQLGYKRNLRGWKFTDTKDKFDLFLSTKKIWENECANIEPKQKDYPLSIKLMIVKVKAKIKVAVKPKPKSKPKPKKK